MVGGPAHGPRVDVVQLAACTTLSSHLPYPNSSFLRFLIAAGMVPFAPSRSEATSASSATYFNNGKLLCALNSISSELRRLNSSGRRTHGSLMLFYWGCKQNTRKWSECSRPCSPTVRGLRACEPERTVPQLV